MSAYVLWWHADTGCHPVNTTRDIHSKLEKHQILVCQQGGTAPCDPIISYLGGSTCEKSSFFLKFSTFVICLKLYLKAKNTSRGSPELPEVLGVHHVGQTWIVLKGLMYYIFTVHVHISSNYIKVVSVTS